MRMFYIFDLLFRFKPCRFSGDCGRKSRSNFKLFHPCKI